MEEYYTRNDVLYIHDASGIRKVILSFNDEPSIYSEGGTPAIAARDADELRDYLQKKFYRDLPENIHPYDKPLRAYSSFHFITKGGDFEPWDFVM